MIEIIERNRELVAAVGATLFAVSFILGLAWSERRRQRKEKR